MLTVLENQNSIANQFIAELRGTSEQIDRMRFRNNLLRLGEIMAYELSKSFHYEQKIVETPLGTSTIFLPSDRIVLATILRAGLPIHQGLLNFFDRADNGFISAYRVHEEDGNFEISMEYITCPDLDGAVLVISDPMLATGASLSKALQYLQRYGKPKAIHVVSVIAARDGVNHINRLYPHIHLWVAAIDEELTAKAYIVPGLGDAGDLAYGSKIHL